MDGLELLADEIDGRLYAAVVRKGTLIDLYVDSADRSACWASVYLGKVLKIDSKLDAAFLDLGAGLMGYLPAKHVRHPGASEAESRTGIAELLSTGQLIHVQVKSEAKSGTANENNKFPRLTMKLYVPGLFLAYMPNSSEVTISRKIEDKNIFTLAAKLKGKGGWLIQPRAVKAAEADIEHESENLRKTWEHILAAGEALKGKPGLLKPGPSALFRALVDYGAMDFEHIHVGNKNILALMTIWCGKHLPALATSKRLRLFKPEKPGQRLFDSHDIYSELESLQDARVNLSAGGSIIIEHTSAMTLIDVNQGSAAGVAQINQDAAEEIARQIRLRGLSGAILVDFINMNQKQERLRLLEALEAALADDTAQAQVHGFTRLGLIELTRKRRSGSLAEQLKKHVVEGSKSAGHNPLDSL